MPKNLPWAVDAEAPELVIDATGKTMAFVTQRYSGDGEADRAEQLANAQHIAAAVNVYGPPMESGYYSYEYAVDRGLGAAPACLGLPAPEES
jgi:hypothetical protein